MRGGCSPITRRIKGAQNAALTLNQKDLATFSQTHDYWEKTGGNGFGGQRVYMSQSAELVIVRIGDVRFDRLCQILQPKLWGNSARTRLVSLRLKDELVIKIRLKHG